MTVEDAINSRRSVRAFRPDTVDLDLLQRLLLTAGRSPSGGNLQPWRIHILHGERLAGFKQLMAGRLEEAPAGEEAEYPIYPAPLDDPYLSRSAEIGHVLYSSLGVARDDKAARRKWFVRNYEFFGAPIGLFCFVDRLCGLGQWSVIGMYLQTLMLLLRAHGLDSCAQECWALYHRTISSALAIPTDQMLFCGMSIGYADKDHPANRIQSPRIAPDDFITVHG